MRDSVAALVVVGVMIAFVSICVATRGEAPAIPNSSPTRTTEQQALWRERLVHLRRLNAIADKRVEVMADEVVTIQELFEVCSTLAQRVEHVRAAQDYPRRLREAEPDNDSFDLWRIENYAGPSMTILDTFREACQTAGLPH